MGEGEGRSLGRPEQQQVAHEPWPLSPLDPMPRVWSSKGSRGFPPHPPHSMPTSRGPSETYRNGWLGSVPPRGCTDSRSHPARSSSTPDRSGQEGHPDSSKARELGPCRPESGRALPRSRRGQLGMRAGSRGEGCGPGGGVGGGGRAAQGGARRWEPGARAAAQRPRRSQLWAEGLGEL